MPRKPLTTAEFITKAEEVHGVGTYDYSQTVYRHHSKSVTIICSTHGAFEQVAGTHLVTTRPPAGCKRCAYERMSALKMGNNQEFIAKAEAVFGVGTYDYSQVVYAGKRAKVSITCTQHGIFKQEPMLFLKGYGCAECSKKHGRYRKAIKARIRTTAEFIASAQAVHGVGTYDYSETRYIDSRLKVKVICAIHGVFEQMARSHNSGEGCPKCAQILRNKYSTKGWVAYASGRKSTLYLIKFFNDSEVFYKIGVTCRPVRFRHRQLELRTGYTCEVVVSYCSMNSRAVHEWEQAILETFAHLRYKPKIRFGGETECFASCDEILAIFPL